MLAIIAVVFLSWLVFGYFAYGRWVAKQFELDDSRETPANKVNDGEDFVPTRPFYLFGQHFSAIAAAGPIAGPIIACHVFRLAAVSFMDRARRGFDRRGSRFFYSRFNRSTRREINRRNRPRKTRNRRGTRDDGVYLDRTYLCDRRIYGHYGGNFCFGNGRIGRA